jgi:hypothetical protein
VPVILVDSGDFLTDQRGYHGDLRPDVITKDQWIFDAYDKFPVEVVNLSSRELRFASRFLVGTSQPQGQNSILGRLVSANIVAKSPDVKQPRPYVIRDVVARGNQIAKVAFIGLTETVPAPPPGFSISDPAVAAKQAVESVRKEADIVVVLARVKPDEAARIAKQAPGIDILVATYADTVAEFFTPPARVGSTDIVYNSFETRMLGEIRFYRQQDGRFSTKLRYITLDDSVPDDPEGLAFAGKARLAEEGARAASKKLLEEWLASSRLREPANSGFIGAESCGACHQAQYVKWISGKHAHASDVLLKQPEEFEASCLTCHASDRQRREGLPFAQGVQCEECHGPGASHAASPGKGYGRIDALGQPQSGLVQKLCSGCHTAAISPSFDIKAGLSVIKH